MANETSYFKIKKYKIYLAIKRTGLFEVCNSVYKNDQIGFRLVKHVQLDTRQCYRVSCVARVSASFFNKNRVFWLIVLKLFYAFQLQIVLTLFFSFCSFKVRLL